MTAAGQAVGCIERLNHLLRELQIEMRRPSSPAALVRPEYCPLRSETQYLF
jgi:hypothetical protein